MIAHVIFAYDRSLLYKIYTTAIAQDLKISQRMNFDLSAYYFGD